MSTLDFDVVIIGGGAVGMACAVHAGAPGRSVLLLERHDRFGQETSSRNSGVIHAGIYYPVGSAKARTCVQGRQLVYDRCARHRIEHRRCGKLIVATRDDERPQLEALRSQGIDNGAGELRMLQGAQLAALEPHVRAVAALHSPETGIVDVHGLLQSYRADARDAGAELLLRTEVTAIAHEGGHFQLQTRASGGQRQRIACNRVVNAAGLGAEHVAALAGIDTAAAGLTLHLCKGDYFTLSPSLGQLCTHLVYPVPAGAGLGIHVTLDLGGQLSAGPDAQYVDAEDYGVDPAKAGAFARAVARYLPGVGAEHLRPGYAGIRPKLQGPGSAFADFVIADAAQHGLSGLINLVGIESPGLTASEAIALRVAELL